MHSKLMAGVFGAALSLAAFSARAEFLTSYDVTIDSGQPVTNILMFETSASGGGTTWAFTANGSGTSGIGETTTLSNPFQHSEPILSSLLIGITQDLDGDTPGTKHVVIMMDSGAALLAQGVAFASSFPNTNEGDLLAAIELATSGQDFSIIQPGLDALSAFVDGDAKTGILDGGSNPVSAWFNMGGSFTVLAWSTGTQIGTGTSSQTAVPEPASLGLLTLGGLMLLARRRAAPAA